MARRATYKSHYCETTAALNVKTTQNVWGLALLWLNLCMLCNLIFEHVCLSCSCRYTTNPGYIISRTSCRPQWVSWILKPPAVLPVFVWGEVFEYSAAFTLVRLTNSRFVPMAGANAAVCFLFFLLQGAVLTPGMDHTMSIQPTSMMGPLTQQLSHLSMGSSGTVSSVFSLQLSLTTFACTLNVPLLFQMWQYSKFVTGHGNITCCLDIPN